MKLLVKNKGEAVSREELLEKVWGYDPETETRTIDNFISRLQADHAKLQNNPTAVKAIVRQNLDPYIDSQAFTRIVMGTYATNQNSTAAQRARGLQVRPLLGLG